MRKVILSIRNGGKWIIIILKTQIYENIKYIFEWKWCRESWIADEVNKSSLCMHAFIHNHIITIYIYYLYRIDRKVNHLYL